MNSTCARSLMLGLLLVATAACGGESDDASDADAQVQEASDSSADDAGDEAEESASGDEVLRAVDSARAGLTNPVEIALSSGGVMVAGIECGIDDAHLLIVGADGLEPGALHEGEIDPASGGGPQFFVQDNGDGYSARQSSYTEASYTVTWPTIDDGVTLTLDGCAS